MIYVTDTLELAEREIQLDFVRASGPGGQNVNKVSSAVQLRFNVHGSDSLPIEIRERLALLSRNRMNNEGILIIDARRFRSQERNRQDAIDRLVNEIQKAATIATPRKKTRPTKASKIRQLENKRRRSKIKQMRKTTSKWEE